MNLKELYELENLLRRFNDFELEELLNNMNGKYPELKDECRGALGAVRTCIEWHRMQEEE